MTGQTEAAQGALDAYWPVRAADDPLRDWVARALAARPNRQRHTLDVADRARRLAEAESLDPDAAERAGLLHDIARAAPLGEHAAIARAVGLRLDDDDLRHPWLVHQRLGAVIAADRAGESDPAVLDAIAFHTTLRDEPAPLDVIVFVADKLGWRKRARQAWQDDADRRLARGVAAVDVARELLAPWDEPVDEDPPALLAAARRWAGVE